MLEVIVRKCAEVDDDDDDEEEAKEAKEQKNQNPVRMNPLKRKATMRNIMSHKIMFLSKVSSLLKRAR